MSTFSEKLRILRKNKEWTQAQLADALSVSESTVQKWEVDKNAPPVSEIKRLAEVFYLPVGDLLGQHLLAGLGGVEPVHQRVVAFLVICLIEGNMGVFFDAVLDQTSDYVDLRVQSIELLLKVIGGQMGLQYFVVDGDDSVLGVDHLVGGPEEDILQLILCERRRGAFLSFKLVIALPDDPAILVIGVPDLRPVPTAAAAALHPAGEDADRAAPVLSV